MISDQKDHYVRTDCRLCGGALKTVLDFGETPLANEYVETPGPQETFPLYISECVDCHHFQLPVVVRPDRLFNQSYAYKSGTSPAFVQHLQEFAKSISRLIGTGGKVLEIASNDGTLLREFVQLGHPWVLGIDPASEENSMHGQGGSLRMFFTSHLAERLSDGSHQYDAIVALNVMAHVADIHDFTKGVARLLKDDGVFVFEVGYAPTLLVKKGDFGHVYAEHLDLWHLRPMVQFFRSFGLELVDAREVEAQGGSVRCFVRRSGEQSDRLKGLLEAEEGFSLEPLKRRITELKNSWEMLKTEIPSTANVAGYGAPARFTTLAHVLGIRNKDLTFIYDDNNLKAGKYTPGTNIPIKSTPELVKDAPDFCIVFAWTTADEIIKRNPDYKGKWIVPLPTFRVVES